MAGYDIIFRETGLPPPNARGDRPLYLLDSVLLI